MHGHTAGVIPSVFQPLQALHQDGNDVVLTDRTDDAAHENARFLKQDGAS
jgi:hypothetical protein